MGIRDLTDADLQKINAKFKNLGFDIQLTPKIIKDITQSAVPKGIKIELDPAIKNEALARAVEGKTMRIAVTPLLTGFREAIAKATRENPPQAEIGVSEARLRNVIQNVLNKQGFLLNISTVNDNYSKVIQQKLNGTRYTVRIHADAKEITRSVQASLMQVQSRYFGLKVSRDILYRSIDEALGQKRFNINIAVSHDQARKAVQDALLRAQVMGKDQALAYQRLQTGEMKAAQAELLKLKAAQQDAASAAKAHATASVNLGGAMGRNITIAGELGSAMASIYSIHAAKEFLSQVIEIGGELEHQKIAMDTIFGDKGKTSELFGQIKGLARQSPFGVMELTKSVKALSAYGVQYNEIYDTAKRLADISAATSVDINRLILAFGKTKSRGFLDGLEAKQFAYANIPIYEMVRKKLEELEGQAVTTQQVMERMRKREISFDIVKDVLWDITDPGGKFYDMQEALAGSVKTSWKLVRDNIELMFGEIAESAVGSGLKSIAEVLQGLTRNWRTLSMGIGAAVVSIGVAKLATFGMNRALDQSTGATIKQILADKQKEAARLRAVRLTQRLTAAEERLIQTSNRLTAEDLKQAFGDQKLSSEKVKMLFLSKQLSAEEVKRLVTMGLIDAQTAKSVIGTNALAGAYARLKVSLAGIKQSVGMFFGSIFNWTTAILAAIGALAMLWQRNSEFNSKAKESSENIYTKAAEGANNLKNTLEEIKPLSAGLSEHELKQGIEQMQNAIKDYSPAPIEDINHALIDQKGHVRELSEQYALLKQRLETLADSYDGIADKQVTDTFESAIKNTKHNFLSDGIEKQYQDLDSALEDLESNILSYEKSHKTSLRNIVEEAADLSPEYRKAIEGMTHDEQKFKELAMNSDKYWKDMSLGIRNELAEARNGGFWSEGLQALTRMNMKNASGRQLAAVEAAKEAARDFVAGFKLELENQGRDLSTVTEDQLRTIFNTYIDGLQLSDDMKKQMRIDVGAELKVSLIEEDPIGDALKDEIKKLASDDTEIKLLSLEMGKMNAAEILKGALLTIQYDGYDALSAAEKEVVDKVMSNAKTNVMGGLALTHDEMAGYLTAHPLEQIINIIYKERGNVSDFQKELWDNNPKLREDVRAPREKGWYSNWTSGSSGYFDTRNKIQQDLESIYNEILAAKKASAEWKKAKQEEFDAKKALAADMGYNDIEVGAKKANRHPKSKDTDEFAKDLRQRFKDIKDAWSEFQKWSKTEGREAAATRIGESGLFSTLSVEQIPQTVEQYRALVVQLENELRKAGVKGTAREGLLNDLLKQLLDIDKTVVDEQLKLALDKVSKEAERQLADWNLFDKIRKATGNQDLAMSVAFGMNADAETDYPALVKKQFDDFAKAAKSALTFDTVTPEALAAAPIEVQKAWEDATRKLQQYAKEQKDAVADILSEYQSLQDKLTKIDADRDRKIKTVQESDKSAPDKAKYIQRIKVEADYQKFTQSADYLKFFSGIYSLTMDKAQEIGDKIRMYLDQRLQAGKISAEDYYKEIDRINQQISKLRNVKSDALTFMTGGLKGLNQKKLEIADSNVLDQMTKVQQAQEALEKAKATGDVAQIASAQMTLNLARHELDTRLKIRDAIVKDMEGWQKILDVVNIAANIAGGLSDAFNSIKDMADAFGVDTETGGWLDVGGVLDTLSSVTSGASKVIQSAMSGDIGGILSGAVSTITTPFTIWAQIHDKKLQKMIERSKEYSQQLQNINDAIERRMENYLGNARTMRVERAEEDKVRLQQLREQASRNLFLRAATRPERERLEKREKAYEEGGAYGYQRQLMAEQLSELEKQRQAELDKKKTDNSVVADYDNQIDEMKVKIRQFAEEAAKDLYGIDLKDWASQLGDALFDAWKKGEDGAEAFKKKAGDILGDVMNSVLKLGLLEPMMQDIQTYLFGEDGKSGAFGEDFELTPDELDGLAAKLMAGMEGVDAYNSALDQLEKILNEKYGLSMKGDKESKSGLSAGIQSVTEDTADLLASYLNGIRGDVSVQTHVLWPKLLDDALPQMNVIAQSQLDAQRQIAENTLRNAVAAEAIMESSDEINRRLARVTQGGEKLYVH